MNLHTVFIIMNVIYLSHLIKMQCTLNLTTSRFFECFKPENEIEKTKFTETNFNQAKITESSLIRFLQVAVDLTTRDSSLNHTLHYSFHILY